MTESRYTSTTTTDEVLEGLDLTGRRIVITGAAGGLGFEAARALSAHGASVVMLGRSADRVAPALTRLRELVPAAAAETGVVDLGDLASIRRFAESFLADHQAIDILMNNAGVMACPLGRTADGFETQFGTNHLGHFLLTALLMPALRQGDSPRVVTLTSAGHSRSDVDLDDPNFERQPYSAWVAYGRSKTANALFARELATRAGSSGLLSFSVHPGGIITELGRHLDAELMADMARFAKERAARSGVVAGGFKLKTVEAGAATQVWASVAPELVSHNGAYLADCGVGVLNADPGANGFLPYLLDDANAARLWELSERLVGARFTI
jgi:NAD(P)-dependent dehydrogenase (short-subunit alcohol dehydrogenase family)